MNFSTLYQDSTLQRRRPKSAGAASQPVRNQHTSKMTIEVRVFIDGEWHTRIYPNIDVPSVNEKVTVKDIAAKLKDQTDRSMSALRGFLDPASPVTPEINIISPTKVFIEHRRGGGTVPPVEQPKTPTSNTLKITKTKINTKDALF